jgi:hypothetical protein
MKKRPLLIQVIAYLYFISPVGIIAELMLLYRIPITDFFSIFQAQYWNWHVFLMTLITPAIGYCIWSVKKWGYYVLLGHSFLILINNFVLYLTNLTFSSIAVLIVFNLVILTIIALFVRKEVYSPYFNPNIRWWEQAKRYIATSITIHVKEFGKNNRMFSATSFDVSETGIYIASDNEVNTGDIYSMEIHLSADSILYADGVVVWVNQGKDAFPKGFGCKFLAVDKVFKKRIKFYVRDVNARERERS